MPAFGPTETFVMVMRNPFRLGILRLVPFIVGSLIWQPAFASPPLWQVDGNESCLASGDKCFCVQNSRITRAWQHGVDLEVSDSVGVVVLYLSFRYLDANKNSQYDKTDGPFELLTTSEVEGLIIGTYRAQLGERPDSAAGVVVITEPAVFELGIVGGNDRIRTEFVDSFVAAWNE